MSGPFRTAAAAVSILTGCFAGSRGEAQEADHLAREFISPPDSARPWVYWFWMDGNLSREGMTADLEAMRAAGLGGMIVMEVDVGVPRGPVKFMSPEWRQHFTHAMREAERLGLQATINAGPGWTGSGGPWVKPEQSMQQVTASETAVEGPRRFEGVLPQPKSRAGFYRDVAVLAFPTPAGDARIADLPEKALFVRGAYSSQHGVRPYLPAPAEHPEIPADQRIAPDRIVDLTGRMDAQGRLAWDVPEGKWTLLRAGRTSTGANTRPAPQPGVGLECDKFDKAALEAHFEAFVGTLLGDLGPLRPGAGLASLHIDSWEMGAQNWTESFPAEFRRRRGYDPIRYLPAMTGRVVDSVEVSERFLWDLRQTAQELVVENHALHLKALGRRRGLGLSIEPYDMNPAGDLSLGSAADVPMCEFWARGHAYPTEFSCIEAASIAHAMGRPVMAAEAFTAKDSEAWRLFPGAMKVQGDWAFAAGINRFVFHRYAHQPWLDRRPGMTMGPWGVHWERTQTWWDMVPAYHAYVARCQSLLQRGAAVADIAYLALEGAPHVFRPPPSALEGDPPDRRGYAFAGLAPEMLAGSTVKDGRIVLRSCASYRVLVLPESETMTPALLKTIGRLARDGATVTGPPPRKSPGLSGYPACDREVQALSRGMWGEGRIVSERGPEAAIKASAPPLQRLGTARWIWHPEGNPAAQAPVGTRRFRRDFALEEGNPVASARCHLTADNAFRLRINGRPAGEGGDFTRVYEFDAAPLLRPGANRLEVDADNGGETPNPAGLIGRLEVRFKDGRLLEAITDARWESALPEKDPWVAARDLGPAGMAPWGPMMGSGVVLPGLYPPYERTVALLARLGLAPDFESDGPVRCIHRRTDAAEIYFVANRESRAVEAACTFRVGGKRPELWDPLDGRIRDLPRFEIREGRTVVPLRFEPHQSFFVVFRKPSEIPAPGGPANFPSFRPVTEIKGPWEVAFDPKLGGPGAVTFNTLEDWTKRPEEGIRFYSGMATYRAGFDLPAGTRRSGLRLSIGPVQGMARVRMNGKGLGTAWCAPWMVEIGEAAKEKGNVLEIDVANLWPNRLIGDRALPAEKRVAWTTWNPYKKDSPLLSSGLLGPVTLEVPR